MATNARSRLQDLDAQFTVTGVKAHPVVLVTHGGETVPSFGLNLAVLARDLSDLLTSTRPHSADGGHVWVLRLGSELGGSSGVTLLRCSRCAQIIPLWCWADVMLDLRVQAMGQPSNHAYAPTLQCPG